MTSQRQDFYHQDVIQCEHLDKLDMRYPKVKDCGPINKNIADKGNKNQNWKKDKLQRESKFLDRNVQRVRTK